MQLLFKPKVNWFDFIGQSRYSGIFASYIMKGLL